jgi:Rrf2 family protein
MKISKKCDYALRALVSLSEYAPEPVSVRKLSEFNDIPRRFLEQIMLTLKEAGWVNSIPGRDGGYFLQHSPSDIALGSIVRLFDGIVAPIACVSVSAYEPCSQENRCRFRRLFLEIRNHSVSLMDKTTFAAILKSSSVDHREVFTDEVMGGLGI